MKRFRNRIVRMYKQKHTRAGSRTEVVARRCSVKKVPPRPEACNLIKKEIWAQVFSCKFCEISQNTYFTVYYVDFRSEVEAFFFSQDFLKNIIKSQKIFIFFSSINIKFKNENYMTNNKKTLLVSIALESKSGTEAATRGVL